MVGNGKQQTAVQQLIEANGKIKTLFHNPKIDALTSNGLPAALRIKFELEERLSAKMNLVAGTQHIKFANDFLPKTVLMDQQATNMSSKFGAAGLLEILERQFSKQHTIFDAMRKTEAIQKHITAGAELFERALSSKKFDYLTGSGALSAAIEQSRFVELSGQTFETTLENLPEDEVEETMDKAYQIINEEGLIERIIAEVKNANKDKYKVEDIGVVILKPIYKLLFENWLKLERKVSFQSFYAVIGLIYLFYTAYTNLYREEKTSIDIDINVNTDNSIEYYEHNHYYFLDNELEKIRELFDLKEKGIITEKEFEAKKKELMERL